MLRDWLRRKEIDSFAMALAQDLSRRFPPKGEERVDKGAKNQLASITEKLYAHAAKFKQEKGLGIYGKAKLGNTFRWRLKELGYSDPATRPASIGEGEHLLFVIDILDRLEPAAG